MTRSTPLITLFLALILTLGIVSAGGADPLDAINPTNEAMDVPAGPVTLIWEAVSGDAVSYDVRFGGSAASMTDVPLPYPSAPMADVVTEEGATYYWQVTAHTVSGDLLSGIWSFTTTVTAPPGEFEIVYPPDGATDVPYGSQTLLWTYASTEEGYINADHYTVYFGSSAGTVKQVPGYYTNDNTLADVYLEEGTKYFWRVVAWGRNGSARLSTFCTFTTKSDPTISGGCVSTPLGYSALWIAPLLLLLRK
ncbi:MAG: hypothetical protein CSA35_02515 [Dethiosulfovibrio peptidovorans]|nr:MAG: hypothetical protein CSA35_02515 [Dethiosulfovibrio peptidovorans]